MHPRWKRRTSLQELYLYDNKMNGTIPESFGQLSKLVNLFLDENSWEGVITEAQLMNLTSLEDFELTTDKNQSLVFNVTYNWVPPFRLKYLILHNCLIGPKFPIWLQVQSELNYSLTWKRSWSLKVEIRKQWIRKDKETGKKIFPILQKKIELCCCLCANSFP